MTILSFSDNFYLNNSINLKNQHKKGYNKGSYIKLT